MNHTLLGADRTTHLKIVAVALIAAIGVVAVGITSRLNDIATSETARIQTDGPVLKAGKPVAVTIRDTQTIR